MHVIKQLKPTELERQEAIATDWHARQQSGRSDLEGTTGLARPGPPAERRIPPTLGPGRRAAVEQLGTPPTMPRLAAAARALGVRVGEDLAEEPASASARPALPVWPRPERQPVRHGADDDCRDPAKNRQLTPGPDQHEHPQHDGA
jgi:hypothetical protein